MTIRAPLAKLCLLLSALASAACLPPLHTAAFRGDEERLRALIDGGEDVDGRASMQFSETALHRAVWYHVQCRTGAVRILLDAGADMEITERDGRTTALCQAIRADCADAVKLMIERGANLHAGCVESALAYGQKEDGETGSVRAVVAALADEPRRKEAAERRARREARRDARPEDLEKALAEERAAEKAAGARRGREALDRFGAALRACAPGGEADGRIRRRAIAFALAQHPAPRVPDEAVRRSDRAQSFIARAKDEKGFESARDELDEALLLAPWWAEAYYNRGLVEEKLEDFEAAGRSFELYLLAAPGAEDAPAVKKKLVDLGVAMELQERPAPPPPARPPKPAPRRTK